MHSNSFQAIPIDAIANEIGRRLNAYRISKELTVQELSEEMGVSKAATSRLLNGDNTTVSTFLRALVALNISDNLDLLVPDVSESPIAKLQRGKPPGRRERVRHPQKPEPKPWSWGDEETPE